LIYTSDKIGTGHLVGSEARTLPAHAHKSRAVVLDENAGREIGYSASAATFTAPVLPDVAFAATFFPGEVPIRIEPAPSLSALAEEIAARGIGVWIGHDFLSGMPVIQCSLLQLRFMPACPYRWHAHIVESL